MNKLRLLEVIGIAVGVLGIFFIAHGIINDSTWGGDLGMICVFGGLALAGSSKLWTYLKK